MKITHEKLEIITKLMGLCFDLDYKVDNVEVNHNRKIIKSLDM